MKFTKYEQFGAYHWKQYDQNTKYRKHADFIKAWVQERNVLDIGAGDGKITALLGVWGIDNEPTAVALAQERGADVVLGDAYNLNYPDESFDAVLMIDVIEHFDDPIKALKEARRVLTDYLYVATPPRRPDGKLTDRLHIQEWTPEELKTFVEKQGFKLEESIVIPEDKVQYAKFRKYG